MAGVRLVNTWIVILRGRRGTYGTGLALVARLVPKPRWDAATPRRFAWQAWHLPATYSHTTYSHTTCLHTTCSYMDRYFAWQAWHLWHCVGSGGALGSQAALGRRGVLRGRRGTL